MRRLKKVGDVGIAEGDVFEERGGPKTADRRGMGCMWEEES